MTERKLIGCSIQVLTKNNASTIGTCLQSLQDFGQVIVQDGYSTDGTREIATQYPNVTLVDQNKSYIDEHGYITNFGELRNETIASARFDWIFPVDADEILSPEEVSEMREIIERGVPGVFVSFRRFYLDGEPIQFCSGYPALQIRLFHRSLIIRGYRKAVHELLDLKPGVSTQMMRAEHPVPLAPARELWAKYRRYIRMEVKRHSPHTYGHWFSVLLRNIRTIIALTLRTASIWLIPRKGKRMPLRYEIQAIVYAAWIAIVLFPPLARRMTKA